VIVGLLVQDDKELLPSGVDLSSQSTAIGDEQCPVQGGGEQSIVVVFTYCGADLCNWLGVYPHGALNVKQAVVALTASPIALGSLVTIDSWLLAGTYGLGSGLPEPPPLANCPDLVPHGKFKDEKWTSHID